MAIIQSLKLALVLSCFWLFSHGLYYVGTEAYPYVLQYVGKYLNFIPHSIPDWGYWIVGLAAFAAVWLCAVLLMAIIRPIQWALRNTEDK